LQINAPGSTDDKTRVTATNGSEAPVALPPDETFAPDGIAGNGKGRDAAPAAVHSPAYMGDVSAPAAESRSVWRRMRSNALFRTRGLWLGLVALSLGLYAQMLTTANRDILNSIHWYTLAIVVLILGWLGTYKNRSLLVVPVRKPKPLSPPAPDDATENQPDR
jgi:hypothetical protein